jgi:hypothetical protein
VSAGQKRDFTDDNFSLAYETLRAPFIEAARLKRVEGAKKTARFSFRAGHPLTAYAGPEYLTKAYANCHLAREKAGSMSRQPPPVSDAA